MEFFEAVPHDARPSSRRCSDVGLGYITLGQPATTLSGGEAQRVKLAEGAGQARDRPHALHPRRADDRPALRTTSQSCSRCSTSCVDAGNTVIVIEHNLDVIKTADWIIDLGPEGGDGGGEIVAEGTPEEIVRVERSYTGRFLKPVLERKQAHPASLRAAGAGRRKKAAGAGE